MTGTTNLGLKKIDGTENWRNIFDYHNDSMDAIDQAVAGVENVEANFAVTIPVSAWTLSNGEYAYTWGNATITSKTSVLVEFVENADEIDVDYIEVEKVTQGVKFTAPWIPNYAISVNIKITYAAETDIAEITGDMVATDVITGAANVDEALTELDTNLSSLNDSLTPVAVTARAATGITIAAQACYRIGKLVVVNLALTIGSTAVAATGNMAVIDDCPPAKNIEIIAHKNLSGGNSQAYIAPVNGMCAIYNNYDTFAANGKYFFSFSYVMA